MAQPLNTSQAASIEWAIEDLKAELNQALRILEDYTESAGNEGSLDDCIQHLRQVTGIFAVSNLALPQMLCEELQSLIKDYSQQTGATAKDTIGIVAEAILELSNFPGNLNRADRLIPQINNLRALTERELFTESSAFEINLTRGLKAFNKSRRQPLDSKTIRKLRTLYQRSVLSLIKEGISKETVADLQKVFKILYQMGGTAYLSAAGYSGLTLIERIQSNQLDLSLAVKSQFKRMDEMLRKLIAGTDYEDTGLLKNILFYVATGSNHSELAARLISIFSLQTYGLDHASSGDEKSEFTNTFVHEAEALRRVIVSIAGAEAGGQADQGASEQLIKTFHRLSDSARTAEFDDLADSFVPLQKTLQHYDSINAPLSNELIALLSIWSGAFDRTLTSLSSGHSYEIEPIHSIGESAQELLLREKKAQKDNPASERKLRFKPLHQLMAEGLDKVIIAEQLLSDWKMEQLSADDQDQMLDELTMLRSVADGCQVSAITELSQLILETQTEFSGESLLEEDAETWFQQAYASLLEMLDSVASWQVIPKVAEDLPSSRPQLAKTTQAALEEPQAKEEFEPVDIQADTPVSSKELSFDTDFLAPDDDFQQELLDTFLEEADDLVQKIDTSISSWKKDPSAMGNADLIHRALHTLKGGARLSGLAKLGDQSHDYESFIIDQQVLQKADETFFTEALERLDLLNEHIEAIREVRLTGGSIAEVPAPEPAADPNNSQDEIPSLHALSAEQLAPSEPVKEDLPDLEEPDSTDLEDSLAELEQEVEPASEAEPVTEPTAESQPESGLEPEPSTQPEPEHPQQAQTQGAETRRDRQEQIRLSAETLEGMVNLSSEATVYRGRIEAQLRGLDTNLDELETTIDRIQQLARRLDTETEAQIQFRSKQLAEAGEESAFDPLEMDRYSTLQQLSHQLMESASDLQDLRGTVSESSRDANVLLVQSGRIQTELNGHLMRTRMVPFERIMPRLERMVRQVSRELGKKAELRALDISGELDRQVLESLLPPIEYILRNAIGHGIESAEERANANKPESGRITANVHRDGSYMVLTLTDDGAGIDFEAVRQRAVEHGVVDEERAQAMNQDDLAEILFTPGFSTAETLTQISGRGVGMDVVRSTLREMGGNVSVRSEPGRGSEFSLSIPFTLSVNRALMVHIGADTYALPLAALEALVRISRSDLESYYNNPNKKLPYGADEYEFGYLGEMLKTLERPPIDAIVDPAVSVVLFRVGNQRAALLVDEILGSHEVVVKSLSQPFNAVAGLSGAAIMADGSVVVTLDMPTLISSHYESKADLSTPTAITGAFEEQRTPTIMVVDDSVTVRKVTSRFLNRAGFVVHTARDGVEALRLVHESQPDLMLVDVEMPRMDGFELLSILKSNETFKDIPVVLITSGTGEKHKQRGLSLGADNYFGKPYREDELLEEINRLLSGERT